VTQMVSAERAAALRKGCECFRSLARLRHPAMSALRSLSGEERTWRGHRVSVAIDPTRTFACKSRAVRIGRRTSTQPQPFQPALRKPLTRWAWSSGRNHGALLRTYMSNTAGARERAFSNASFASAVRPS